MKKACALLLALCLTLGAVPAMASTVRRTNGFTAKTLDYLPEKARARTDSLVIGVSDLYGVTSPFFAETTGDGYLTSLLYDELIFFGNDGSAGDGAATMKKELVYPQEIWLRIEGTDYTSYRFTFTVRDGVCYADGTPVTSDDFINAFYLLFTPGYDGVYDAFPADIKGATAYYYGGSDEIEGIQRVDEKTFTIDLEGKNASAEAFLAVPALRVSEAGEMKRPEGLSMQEREAYYEDALSRARNVDPARASYGQYALETLETGAKATLSANGSYWRGAPKISAVELLVVPTGDEMRAMLDGDVDIITMMGNAENVDEIWDYEKGFVNLYNWENSAVGYLGMNLRGELFSDMRVRQAIAVGLDRETILANTLERYGTLNTQMKFDEFSLNSDVLGEQYSYDVERARRLLDEAGWKLGEDGCRQKDGVRFAFTFSYATPSPVMDKAAGMIAAGLRQLGMEVTLNPVALDELIDAVEDDACDMYFMARQLPQRAAVAARMFAGDSHLNLSGYRSDMLDYFFTWLCQESDTDRQTVMLEAYFEELYRELPVIPLYQRSEVLLVGARILNCTVTAAHEITSDVYRFMLTDTLSKQW